MPDERPPTDGGLWLCAADDGSACWCRHLLGGDIASEECERRVWYIVAGRIYEATIPASPGEETASLRRVPEGVPTMLDGESLWGTTPPNEPPDGWYVPMQWDSARSRWELRWDLRTRWLHDA